MSMVSVIYLPSELRAIAETPEIITLLCFNYAPFKIMPKWSLLCQKNMLLIVLRPNCTIATFVKAPRCYGLYSLMTGCCITSCSDWSVFAI